MLDVATSLAISDVEKKDILIAFPRTDLILSV